MRRRRALPRMAAARAEARGTCRVAARDVAQREARARADASSRRTNVTSRGRTQLEPVARCRRRAGVDAQTPARSHPGVQPHTGPRRTGMSRPRYHARAVGGAADEIGDVRASGDVDHAGEWPLVLGELGVHLQDPAQAREGLSLQLDLDRDESRPDRDAEVGAMRRAHGAAVVAVAQVKAPEDAVDDVSLADPLAAADLEPCARPRARAHVRPGRGADRPWRTRRRVASLQRATPGQHDQRSVTAAHRDASYEAGGLQAPDVVIGAALTPRTTRGRARPTGRRVLTEFSRSPRVASAASSSRGT